MVFVFFFNVDRHQLLETYVQGAAVDRTRESGCMVGQSWVPRLGGAPGPWLQAQGDLLTQGLCCVAEVPQLREEQLLHEAACRRPSALAIRCQGDICHGLCSLGQDPLTFRDLETITHPLNDPREDTASDPDPPIHHPVLTPCKDYKSSGPGSGELCRDRGEQYWLQPPSLHL